MDRSSEQIKQDVLDQLIWDSRIDQKGITVEVKEGTVVLAGTVSSFMEYQADENDAWVMPGVESVDNRLIVTRPENVKSPEDNEILWMPFSI